MPWCPKCKTEYRPGFDTCADCHVPLVDELPAEPEMPKPPVIDLGEPALLTTMDNELEADMLLAMLTDQGIPAYKLFQGAWGGLSYSMAITSLCVEVYVPQRLLTQAQELAEYFAQ